MLPEQRHWFEGLEKVDSYSFNPHSEICCRCCCCMSARRFLRLSQHFTTEACSCQHGTVDDGPLHPCILELVPFHILNTIDSCRLNLQSLSLLVDSRAMFQYRGADVPYQHQEPCVCIMAQHSPL